MWHASTKILFCSKMEIVVDVKIETKMPSYINVITDFGYFKKITGESVSQVSCRVRPLCLREEQRLPFCSLSFSHNRRICVSESKHKLHSKCNEGRILDETVVERTQQGVDHHSEAQHAARSGERKAVTSQPHRYSEIDVLSIAVRVSSHCQKIKFLVCVFTAVSTFFR